MARDQHTEGEGPHRELNGKTVGLAEAFVTSKGNRLMMPCDPDCRVAEETVNCHCYLTYS